jgi:hypothetical protein
LRSCRGEKNLTRIQWPDGKAFAFTVFDDTDRSVPGNYEAVYTLLRDRGLRTTKSVWLLPGQLRRAGGATCEEPRYLAHILALQREGFEIGFHGTTYHGVERPMIERGLHRFHDLFGHYPRSMANHDDSAEGMYWGDARVSGSRRLAYNLLTRGRQRGLFQGHRKGSPYFWGDICLQHIDYLRNFIIGDMNTLKAIPWMPYHDLERPFVKQWFSSSEGPEVNSFVRTILEEHQDRLEAEGGACIMYTHFAVGFQDARGTVHPRFKQLIERLSKKNGWFVPVATLLDHIRNFRGEHVLTSAERMRMECRWLLHKIRVGGTS